MGKETVREGMMRWIVSLIVILPRVILEAF